MHRVRSLTEKGMEQYIEQKDARAAKLQKQQDIIEQLISSCGEVNEQSHNLKELIEIKRQITDAIRQYDSVYQEFKGFLTRTCTQESNLDSNTLAEKENIFKSSVKVFIDHVEDILIVLGEQLSTKSASKKGSSSIKGSVRGSVIAVKKAEAEVARVKSEFAEKQAALLLDKALLHEKQTIESAIQERKRTILETEINVLKSKEEAAVAAAEAEILDSFTESVIHNEEINQLSNISKENPTERVATYLNSIPLYRGENIQDQPLDPKAPVFLPNMSHPANHISCNPNESNIQGVPADITRF